MSDWARFPFGKYKMRFFDEIDDIGYLKWYISQLNNDRQIRCCAKAIVKAVDKKYKAKEGE